MSARPNVSALATIVVAATASLVILFVIRTVGASNLPTVLYWLYWPAIVIAAKSSGNFDAPNEALLSLGMFLETFAVALGAACLLHRRRGGSRT
jgi:hypothetical protein